MNFSERITLLEETVAKIQEMVIRNQEIINNMVYPKKVSFSFFSDENEELEKEFQYLKKEIENGDDLVYSKEHRILKNGYYYDIHLYSTNYGKYLVVIYDISGCKKTWRKGNLNRRITLEDLSKMEEKIKSLNFRFD